MNAVSKLDGGILKTTGFRADLLRSCFGCESDPFLVQDRGMGVIDPED